MRFAICKEKPPMKLLLLPLAVLLLVSTSLRAEAPGLDIGSGADPRDLPMEELRLFAEVIERIRAAYVEDVDDSELLEAAIRGMLNELDPHSAYLSPDEFDDLRASTRGEFGGIGIEISMDDGLLRVVAPIDDTPASEAGLQAGDMILRIDDESVRGMTMQDAVNKLRGEPGTEVELQLLREGSEAPEKVTLTRDTIRIQSVRSDMPVPGFGYLRVSQFQRNTAEDLRTHLKDLKEREELKGLVLDLRNNPGGTLDAAVDVADVFLDSGLVVYTQGRDEGSRVDYEASSGDAAEDIPVVVLVNSGSASASEIVAGALQDQGRGIVMGRPTFGKGSVQTVLPLHQERALKLTTARYYTPSGRSIQAEGIAPDIEVDVARVEVQQRRERREADLPRHLLGEREAPVAEEPEKEDDEEEEPLVSRDYMLYQAISVLRGIELSGRLRR